MTRLVLQQLSILIVLGTSHVFGFVFEDFTLYPSTSLTTYGDVDDLTPKGQLKSGVLGSQKAIRQDIKDLNNFKKCYDQVAAEQGIQAAVIAAIASRASRGGRLLKKTNGYGYGGNGYGIMQCHKTSGLKCTDCRWDSCCHVRMMVSKKLIPDIKIVAKKHPTWTKAQQLQGGVAAYNFGTRNVQTWKNLDKGSSGNDYSNDVMARAQYLRSEYGWD